MISMKKIIVTALTAALLFPAAALAAPKVNLTLTAEKEVVVTENGQEVTKRVSATEIIPGETLIYTIRYENVGDEAATNVAIVDPIPAGAAYINGSATEAGDLTFSIDGGQSYKKPSLLVYEVKDASGKNEKRIASPDRYTHIRWLIPAIQSGEKGSVSFQVLMK